MRACACAATHVNTHVHTCTYLCTHCTYMEKHNPQAEREQSAHWFPWRCWVPRAFPRRSEPRVPFQSRGLLDATWVSFHLVGCIWVGGKCSIPLLGENKSPARFSTPAVTQAVCSTKLKMNFQGTAAQLVSSHLME